MHGYTIGDFECLTESILPFTKEESFKYTDKWEEINKEDKIKTTEEEAKDNKQSNKKKGKSKKKTKDEIKKEAKKQREKIEKYLEVTGIRAIPSEKFVLKIMAATYDKSFEFIQIVKPMYMSTIITIDNNGKDSNSIVTKFNSESNKIELSNRPTYSSKPETL